jgi:poly(3-hydroxyalkanoate) depolymerase
MAPREACIGARTVRYAVGGAKGADRTLLLFNGIGASVETVAELIAGFERTRVVAFDAPGVGGSPAPLLPYRMHDVARLAVGLLDHLGVDRADVFGVSWGSAAAQEFAIHHPERCRTLTLAATCAGGAVVPGHASVMLELPNLRSALDPAGLLAAGSGWFGGWLRLNRDVMALRAEALRELGRPGYLYQLLAVWGWTSWHRLHRVHAPTLVLVGIDDPIVPPINGRMVAAGLRRATLESVDCGHLFVLTRPGETAARVERFIFESC